MERKIVKSLLAWKNKPDKLPLLLQGARQVGKTYTLLSFGKQHYKNVAYFSMEDSMETPAVFARDLNPVRIVRELAARSGQTILLGVAMKRENFSFPVGKVDMLRLFPMDFEEFLWAVGQNALCGLIREAYDGFTPLSLHDTAMDWYKTYLVVGGMPRAVQEYAGKRDFDFVAALQRTLNDSYIADMAKYATPQETNRIMAAWASVPAQLAKENHKFQYKVIRSGARAGDYAVALDWLKAAGMIHTCVHVTEGKLPLSAYAENETFKVYMADTGLLCSKFGIPPGAVLHAAHTFDGFKGALAENYICQALVAADVTPYYWASQGKAKVDFVFQEKSGDIIPLEAKSAENVRSKSLRAYRDIYKPVYSIRVSAKNFGFENGIKSIPLYAMFCLTA
ncbi:MAG: DUF4143 domain-containing protein [Clostridiales Family XIII bacterium]|jgi:predicted AAA+ superfamily ATPase|nr:DUF4143 domain-containing protein [Clostridiales Family XIII bacterium]